VGRCPVRCVDGEPATTGVDSDDKRNRERHGGERAAYLALKCDAIYPGDATVGWRKLSAVVIVVGVEVLMDRGVRVVRAGVMAMCLRERGGQGQARHERQADDRRAQLAEHESDYGRRRPVRQTPLSPPARPRALATLIH
jgi:hypothetical protein